MQATLGLYIAQTQARPWLILRQHYLHKRERILART